MKIAHNGKAAILFGLSAMIIYVMMVLGTLTHLSDLAMMQPFDLRPTGYSQADATGLLESLGEAGRQYYLTRQIPLDTLYPALLALTLISALRWRAAKFGPTVITRIGGTVAILAAVFDYLENLGIVFMLLAGAGSHPMLIYAASMATILKSALTSVAILAVFATLAPILFQRFMPQRPMKSARRSSRLS